MSVNAFLCFVKWYFDYIGNKCFDNSPPKIQTVAKVRRKERLPIVICAYLLMIASALLIVTLPSHRYLLSFGMMIAAIGLLFLCRFSLIYYLFLYVRYHNKNTSINDDLIVYECILLDTTNEIRKMISKYFRIVEVKGNIFSLKFTLADKSKKRSNRVKLSPKDIVTLKFKPNAIFFDKQKIHAGKLLNLSDLDKMLYEAQRTFTSRV